MQVNRGTASPVQPSLISIDIDDIEMGAHLFAQFSTAVIVTTWKMGALCLVLFFCVQVTSASDK